MIDKAGTPLARRSRNVDRSGDAVLAREDELTVLLRRICQQAIHAIPEADMASLRSARRYRQTLELVAQLREALTTRAVIDQAKGVLIAVRRISAAEAFAVLVEQSQQENIKVRDLAERFIADIISRWAGPRHAAWRRRRPADRRPTPRRRSVPW